MKFAGLLFAALLTTACTAQTNGLDVALDLYKTCAKGMIAATGYDRLPTKQVDIESFVLDLDQSCYNWTVAWFPTFYPPGRMSSKEINAFYDNRVRFVSKLAYEMEHLKD